MRRLFLPAVVVLFLLQSAWASGAEIASRGTLEFLAAVMDQYHTGLDVYTDASAAGNHFAARGRMSSDGDEAALPPMDEDSQDAPHSGRTCIRARFQSMGDNWGGWYWMNGALADSDRAPRENWGDLAAAGVNLSGATRLTLWAKGATGGERVEFFCLGVGRRPGSGWPVERHPDSAPRASTGYVTLTPEWREYHLDLGARDLHYVLGGFGWITNAAANRGRDIAFLIDDIRYDCARLSAPRFLRSFAPVSPGQTVDQVLANTAFTYDNALALLAFLAAGEKQRAGLIADALVYAQQHDRFYTDGRLRNAYQAGDLATPPGWTPNGRSGSVRLPGWQDASRSAWSEDVFQVSTHTGNLAWAMLALLAYQDAAGEGPYLAAAERLAQWVEENCRDARGAGGYTAGFEGWEPTPSKLLYKAAEHNIDLYAAFRRLSLVTGNQRWQAAAEHAKGFIVSLWDAAEGKFWTGTGDDGITTDKGVIPVDIQAWALLSLRQEGKPFVAALDYAERHLSVGAGFDFNQDRDAVWFEGTAQMALAYRLTAQPAKYQALATFLRASADSSGGLMATDQSSVTTGFFLPDGQPWLYYRRLHVGATAWALLAECGTNPFWLGDHGGGEDRR